MTLRILRLLLIAIVLSALAAACGGDKKVGDDSLLEGTKGGGAERLGETTTIAAAPGAPAAPAAPVTTAAATKTTSPAPAPATTAAARVAEVTINSDKTAGGQFQPRVAQVFAGGTVRFVNKDSAVRSVVADDGSFDSGPIQPGASWSWVAGGPGIYKYADGTRPYAVGDIEVRGR